MASEKFESLTDDDVRQIGLLIEMLDRSGFDYLRLDAGTLKVVVGKGAVPAEVLDATTLPAPSSPSAPAAPASVTPAPMPRADVPASARAASAPSVVPAPAYGPDVVEIKAPMLGRFYAQPEPGAPVFVTVGGAVNATTTVGLIEVMKVYTSVEAGVAGTVLEICVENGAYVEFGQVLLRIRKG